MPKRGGSLILGRQPGEFVDPASILHNGAADVGISMELHVKFHGSVSEP